MTCASPTTCPSGAGTLTLGRSAAHGMVTSLSQGNISESWTYNTFGELATQVSTFSSSPLLSLTYDQASARRDNLGRVATRTEARGGVTTATAYTYDPLGRLYQVRYNGTLVEQYTYDNNGNRLTGLDGGVTSTGTYDAQDRLLTYGDWTFAYTANGELQTKTNTVTGQIWTYEYDVSGNLLAVDLPDGRQISYLHDGRNRRIAKLVDTVVVRRWVYGDQLNPVLELDGTGAPLFRYVYGSMKHSPDYLIDATGVNYRVIRDQLGSPLLIGNTTNSSDVMLNASYSAFGRRMVTSGAPVLPTLGFAGGIYDEDTGLTRFGARDYDPVVGRWTAKDPIRWQGGQSNLFAYAENDPINLQDPDGRNPGVIPIAIAVGEAAVAVAEICLATAIVVYDWFSDDGQTDDQPSKEECDRQWSAAHEKCGNLLTERQTAENKRMVGPVRTLDACAKGHVSAACGGAWRNRSRARSDPPGRGSKGTCCVDPRSSLM